MKKFFFFILLLTLNTSKAFTQTNLNTWQPFWPGTLNAISRTTNGLVNLYSTDGATEAWYFGSVASSNVTSRIIGETYTAAGDPTYMQDGPFPDIKSIAFDGTGDYFTNTGPDSSIATIGAQDFVLAFQVKNTGTGLQYIADFDLNGSTVNNGWYLLVTATNINFGIGGDDGGTDDFCSIDYAHGGTEFYNENVWYDIVIVVDRSETKPKLLMAPAGNALVEKSTTKNFANLSAISDISIAGGLRFGARESDGSFGFTGNIAQAAVAVGTITYRPYP